MKKPVLLNIDELILHRTTGGKPWYVIEHLRDNRKYKLDVESFLQRERFFALFDSPEEMEVGMSEDAKRVEEERKKDFVEDADEDDDLIWGGDPAETNINTHDGKTNDVQNRNIKNNQNSSIKNNQDGSIKNNQNTNF